jgi:glycine/D-amino acid oxidase-like deaminating enzyme
MPPVDGLEDDDMEMDSSQLDTEARFMVDPLDSAPVAHPVLIDLERDFQARCDPRQGRTRVEQLGLANAEEIESPDGWTPEQSDEFGGWAHEAISGRLPIYRDQEDLGTHSAWLTVSPDGVPVVGPVDSMPGLYIMTGFSGRDFHLAPSIGEGLAQMILGQPISAFDPTALSPSRFA